MPGEGNYIMVFYAFGYHRDLGNPGRVCTGCKAHNGDSEFIVMEIVPASNRGDRWGMT